MNKLAILPTSYLAPIAYYSELLKYPSSIIEHYENYPKQTYRSRCDIYSPNGLLTLSVPLVKRNHRQMVKDLKISYDYNWQILHWRTLESSYKRSPFFEYYEDDFYPIINEKKFEFLIDLNEILNQQILTLLKQKPKYSFTTEYHKIYSDAVDFRDEISPKKLIEKTKQTEPLIYSQVFETKHGFIPNLSIVDLLFNHGSRAMDYV